MADASSGRARLARTLGRRGLVAALAAAGGVFALLLIQSILASALRSIGYPFDIIGTGTSLLQQSLAADLPFAIGVFLALWQILPIAPELRFAHVVTRSLFAAGVGAAAVLVVQTVLLAVVVAAGTASGFSDLGRAASQASARFWRGELNVLVQSVLTWVNLVPIVVLAGLLLWGFLQRFAPDHSVSGVVDEL